MAAIFWATLAAILAVELVDTIRKLRITNKELRRLREAMRFMR